MKRLIFSIVLSLSVFSAMAGVQVVPLPCGEAVMLIATPYSGYKFDSWTDGNTENPRVVSIEQDTIFGANWRECPIKKTSISKNIYKGDSFVFGDKALTKKGTYRDTLISSTGCDSIVTLNLNVIAKPTTFAIKVVSDDISRGTVSGSGMYNAKTYATISATPLDDWVFEKWDDGNTDNPRSVLVTGNMGYTAFFTKYLQVNLTVNNPTMGSASYDGSNKYGETITCTAVANNKYKFLRWLDEDGVTLSNESEYAFTLLQDMNIKAVFDRAPRIVVTRKTAVQSVRNSTNNDPLCIVVVDKENVDIVDNQSQHIAIFNSAGQLLTTKTNVIEFSMKLPTGVYIIQADDQIEKFVVQ